MYKTIEKKSDFILVEQEGKQYHIPYKFKAFIKANTACHKHEGQEIMVNFTYISEKEGIYFTTDEGAEDGWVWYIPLCDIDITPFLVDDTPPMPTSEELEHCWINVLGRVTTVMYDNTYTGTATCSHDDTFDLNTGVAWAYKRAMEAKKKAEEDNIIKVGDIVKVTNAGRNYNSNTDWIIEHITDIDLIARFAYGDFLSSSPDKNGEFKVHCIANNKAYIEHTGNGSCRVIDIEGIAKVEEEEWCITDKEEEDDSWLF